MFEKFMNSIIDWIVKIGDSVVIGIDKYSFDICLLIGLVALILSVFGYDKGKKIALICPAAYVIIQIFLKGWFGV